MLQGGHVVKVLFLDHPEADFLSAIMYLGLTQELGAENVIEYPNKPSFHGIVHRYPACYPVGSQGVQQEGAEGVTGPFAWMPAVPAQNWSRDRVVDGLLGNEFGLCIVASPRRFAVEAFHELSGLVGRNRMPTTVLIDGEDYADIRWDIADPIRPHIYFKRELITRAHGRTDMRIEPCPFASPIGPVHAMALEERPAGVPVVKDIDVMFLGGATWPGRAQVNDALRASFGDRVLLGGGRSYPEYLDAIARSKIAISVRGHGYDTLRFWEISSFSTLLVCDETPLIMPEPFIDGKHCRRFNSPQRLIEVVKEALDADWRQTAAFNGNAHLRAHHTARARARYVLRESIGYQ